ncbi:MAG: hypothetical protein KKE96_02115 [Candidatus Altiarchaeota archaeon]|nr:hypothetical protein [Candidatus Altiarchaeota archaeon]
MKRRLKKECRRFLRKTGVLSVSKKSDYWRSFEFEQGDKKYKKGKRISYNKLTNKFHESTKKEINKKGLKKIKGIYVYKKGKTTLYVGEGKLSRRFKAHYKQSLGWIPESSSTKKKKRFRFWSLDKNKGAVRIYWKEIRDDRRRKVIEAMLEYVSKSKYKSHIGD